MKFRANTILLYIVSALLVALIGFLVFLVYQSYAYKDQIAVLISETAVAAHRRTSLSSLEAAVADAQPSAALIHSRFIEEEAVPDFISSLERLGVERSTPINIISVDLDKVDPKAVKKGEKPGLRALRMRLDGVGSWQQNMGFIAALETLPSAISVQGVSLAKSAPPEGEPQKTWRFTLDIIQYVAN